MRGLFVVLFCRVTPNTSEREYNLVPRFFLCVYQSVGAYLNVEYKSNVKYEKTINALRGSHYRNRFIKLFCFILYDAEYKCKSD